MLFHNHADCFFTSFCLMNNLYLYWFMKTSAYLTSPVGRWNEKKKRVK